MHHYCDEIKAGSDVTQTDLAVALRRRFGEANILALNERLQICRKAQLEVDLKRRGKTRRLTDKVLKVLYVPVVLIASIRLTEVRSVWKSGNGLSIPS